MSIRIESINLPEEYCRERGLGPIRMDRLGKVVVLAGPNGAGKTRLLRLLMELRGPFTSLIGFSKEKLEESLRTQRLVYQGVAPGGARHETAQKALKQAQDVLTLRSSIKVSGSWGNPPPIVELTLDPHLLDDARELTPKRLFELSATLRAHTGNPYAQPQKGAISSYLQVALNRFWEASHPACERLAAEKEAAIADWVSLVALLEHLLPGCSPSRDLNGGITFYGRPLGEAQLSDGQKVLIVVAAQLHAQKTDLENIILLIDEPENHLHPAALIEFMRQMASIQTGGQVWVATHSVNLLSTLADSSNLWFINDGNVHFSGRTPEKVLNGLLGDEEARLALERFVQLPVRLSMERFAAESLLPPFVAMTGPEDKQSVQIAEGLRTACGHGQDVKFRVLDYGAGRGRILAALEESLPQIGNTLEYFAFEPAGATRSECGIYMDRVFGQGYSANHLFADYTEMRRRIDTGSIDRIIMCNVLHEVDPGEWPELFGSDGIVRILLKPGGDLRVVEDMRIPAGEHAHRFGFLLLPPESLKQLFELTESDTRFVTESHEGKGRLCLSSIPGYAIARYSAQSRSKALEELARTAKASLRELRRAPRTDYQSGHLHALWALLLTNAQLALESLG
jgi:ABC-type cobalamin/Fe3+-siderophores transport system ATPase subunit